MLESELTIRYQECTANQVFGSSVYGKCLLCIFIYIALLIYCKEIPNSVTYCQLTGQVMETSELECGISGNWDLLHFINKIIFFLVYLHIHLI